MRIRSWLWRGRNDLPGFSDNVYGLEYVRALLGGLGRNLTGRWQLELWVDDFWAPHVEALWLEVPLSRTTLSTVRFRGDDAGGWSRMLEIFHPEHAPARGERILAVGLDSIFVGPCDWLFDWKKAPCGWIVDPYYPKTISNSVMTFNEEGASLLWERYQDAKAKDFSGARIFDLPSEMMLMRQVQEEKRWPVLEETPRRLLSYKAHTAQGVPKDPACDPRVIYFHGSPKPGELAATNPLRWHWR